MSESRKIHQSDVEQPKDGDHVALDGDKEFRTSRISLSKEKASPDGAHEKLIQKEDEAKIVRDMRVDVVDAKYVSGDHRNGDPKIELDANKKQFSGLTKEELMKYADDPFWVNLRWFMFVLFWAMWLGMLAAAIAIIVRAPKCAPPAPRTCRLKAWRSEEMKKPVNEEIVIDNSITLYEKGPLVDLQNKGYSYSEIESKLPLLKSCKVEGIFMEVPTYKALYEPDVVAEFKALVDKAKEYNIRVIADLTPNYVPAEHMWFLQSVNKTAPYTDYFKWAASEEFDSADHRKEPNNWVSTLNGSAWSWSETRQEFYLHQFDAEHPDLDFNNPAVLEQFTKAVGIWMGAGASGIRLNKPRLMVVSPSLKDEEPAEGRAAAGAGHTDYAFYRHAHTADQPALHALLKDIGAAVDAATSHPEEIVFTLKEERSELFLLGRDNGTQLRPASSAPVPALDAGAAAAMLDRRLQNRWPIVQLTSNPDSEKELALFALLLPATPVFDITQLDNDTSSDSLAHLAAIRQDGSVEHGHHSIASVPGYVDGTNVTGKLLACARWKTGHTGYLGVFNPSKENLRANLTSFSTVPATLTVHHASHAVRATTNYTNNYSEEAHNVLVPASSTVILSYVPQNTAEH